MQPEQPNMPSQPQAPYVETPAATLSNDSSEEPPLVLPETQPVQWQAPEYIQELRSPKWFIAFWAVVIILMAVAIVLLKSWSFALLIPAMAAALMIYSHRPPQVLNYVLSDKGLYINEKLHPMSEFKSFGVLKDDSLPSLMLIPVKRFRPGLTIHFPAEIGEAVVDLLGNRIPMQELKLDVFDQLIRKLHI